MSSRSTLKDYFKKGDVPTQDNFSDLIESVFIKSEDGIRKQGTAAPVALEAQADDNGEQQVLHFYKSFMDKDAAWKFSLLNQNSTNPASGLSISSAAAGQSSLFIRESDGNVGVGTTSPGAKLHVSSGDVMVDGAIRPSNGNNSNTGIYFSGDPAGGSGDAAWIRYRAQNYTDDTAKQDDYTVLEIGTSNDTDDHIALIPSGNVGIGTTNPFSKLSNTNINIIGADGNGGGSGSFAWAANQRGYSAQIFNQGSNSNSNGLVIRVASDNARALDVCQGANWYDRGTSLLAVNGNGYVGIGINSPGAKLHVSGGDVLVDGAIRPSNGNTAANGIYFSGDPAGGSGDAAWIRYRAGNYTGTTPTQDDWTVLEIGTSDNTNDHIAFMPSGNVGIGVTYPLYPLDVRGKYTAVQGQKDAFEDGINHSSGIGWGNANKPISIHSDYGILAGYGYYLASDKRIKKQLTNADTHEDLELLNRLAVTSFQYKNEAVFGDEYSKGFIAQDVEKVFPQAVRTNFSFIPDIYSFPDNCYFSNNKLIVCMKDNHNLHSGDVVQIIIADDKTKEVTVKVMNEKEFIVEDWSDTTASLFVYGKKVNDFRSLDYQQIFTLGISAIQELYKQLQQLSKEVETIKEKLSPAFAPAL